MNPEELEKIPDGVYAFDSLEEARVKISIFLKSFLFNENMVLPKSIFINNSGGNDGAIQMLNNLAMVNSDRTMCVFEVSNNCLYANSYLTGNREKLTGISSNMGETRRTIQNAIESLLTDIEFRIQKENKHKKERERYVFPSLEAAELVVSELAKVVTSDDFPGFDVFSDGYWKGVEEHIDNLSLLERGVYFTLQRPRELKASVYYAGGECEGYGNDEKQALKSLHQALLDKLGQKSL